MFQPTLTESGLGCFGLSVRYALPTRPLNKRVHSFLQVNAIKPTAYLVIPDGTQSVYMSSRSIMIGGAQSRAREILIPSAGEYFGIRFYPGALRHFLDIDLSEITDEYMHGHCFIDHDFSALHNQIYQLTEFYERVRVCEQWLMRYLVPRPNPKLRNALFLIEHLRGDIRVSQLASELRCSDRQLNRLFRQHVGLSTKAFANTVRLQHVTKQLYTSPSNTRDLAFDHGYFDQSHLINNFRKHMFSEPRSFFEQFMSDFYNTSSTS